MQCLAKQTDFWGVFIQNANRHNSRNLPKSYDKGTNFCSIDCINVESFSSFGCKNFDIYFPLLKLKFLVLSTLKACNTRTSENFGTKTVGQTSNERTHALTDTEHTGMIVIYITISKITSVCPAVSGVTKVFFVKSTNVTDF